MPGFWLVALMTGVGLGVVSRWPRHPLPRSGLLLLAAIAVAVQCWLGAWDRERYITTEADLAKGQEVLDTIASFDGPVLMPHSPWYPVMLGKPPSFALIALWDITHRGSPLKREAKAIDRAIREQRFDAIILAKHKFEHGVGSAYEHTSTIKHAGRTFYPKTGWRVRPRYVYEPKAEPTTDPTEDEAQEDTPASSEGDGEE
jgi:hypothetical protein